MLVFQLLLLKILVHYATCEGQKYSFIEESGNRYTFHLLENMDASRTAYNQEKVLLEKLKSIKAQLLNFKESVRVKDLSLVSENLQALKGDLENLKNNVKEDTNVTTCI